MGHSLWIKFHGAERPRGEVREFACEGGAPSRLVGLVLIAPAGVVRPWSCEDVFSEGRTTRRRGRSAESAGLVQGAGREGGT